MKNKKGLILSKRSESKGFTLIELLVVIALIGILTGIIIVGLNLARAKAKDSALKATMSDLRTQIEMYYATNGTYTSLFSSASPSYRCDNSVIDGLDSSVQPALKKMAELTGCSNNSGDNINNLCIYCKSDPNRYVVIAKLPSSPIPSDVNDTTAFSWCFDSGGVSQKINHFAFDAPNRYNCIVGSPP